MKRVVEIMKSNKSNRINFAHSAVTGLVISTLKTHMNKEIGRSHVELIADSVPNHILILNVLRGTCILASSRFAIEAFSMTNP